MKKIHPFLIPVKKNCPFSLFGTHENFSECEFLELHFGVMCIERVPNQKSHFLLKLLVARLYISGFQLKGLCEVFPYSQNSVRKWGRVLKEGNAQEIADTFGLDRARKMTPEVCSYVEYRYRELLKSGELYYRRKILEELSDIFQLKVSGETLRVIFRRVDAENDETSNSEGVLAEKEDLPVPPPDEPGDENPALSTPALPAPPDSSSDASQSSDGVEKISPADGVKTQDTCAPRAQTCEEARKPSDVSV